MKVTMDGFEKSIKLHAGVFEFKKADLIDFRGTRLALI